MPQMAPISWLILMIFFSSCFLIFNVLNYFCLNSDNLNTNKNNKIQNNKNLNLSLTWKW